MDFLKRLEEHRSLGKMLAWEGTFADYLDIVKRNSSVSQLAHSRIYEMIKAAGVEEVGGVKRYKFFASEIFGLDKTWKSWSRNIFTRRPGGWTCANVYFC
jgi:serine protein kinase